MIDNYLTLSASYLSVSPAALPTLQLNLQLVSKEAKVVSIPAEGKFNKEDDLYLKSPNPNAKY